MRGSHVIDVVPGQEQVDIGLFVPASNGCQDTGQIAMEFNPVEFAGLDQRRDDGPVLRAGIVTCEGRGFAIEGDGTDGALDGVGIQFDAAVVEEQDQPVPVFGDVFQGFSGWRFCRDTGAVLGEPEFEGVDEGF